MPFYSYIMEQNGHPVTKVAYYSFENKRYRFVIGGPKRNMATVEEMLRSSEGTKGRVVDMRRRIAEGDYRIGGNAAADCSTCGLAGICRYNYSLDT